MATRTTTTTQPTAYRHGDLIIHATDKAVLELFPKDKALARWIKMAQERVAFQGLPARICWLGLGERAEMGLRINHMVAKGKLKAV